MQYVTHSGGPKQPINNYSLEVRHREFIDYAKISQSHTLPAYFCHNIMECRMFAIYYAILGFWHTLSRRSRRMWLAPLGLMKSWSYQSCYLDRKNPPATFRAHVSAGLVGTMSHDTYWEGLDPEKGTVYSGLNRREVSFYRPILIHAISPVLYKKR